uniref:Uncharacterized protein n=1 Tax=Arundo donax TaxID=35708 RepID=A0A0A9GT48_ARUDO
MVTSAGSDAGQKGKGVVFDQSDEDEDEVAEDVVWPPQQRRPQYRRAASTMGGGEWRGEAGRTGAGGTRPVQDGGAPDNNPQHARPPHRRHATEFAGGNAHPLHEPLAERRPYVAPPYRRNPTVSTATNGGAYESSAYVHPPYSRIVSALERSNEHIARHEEVRRIGTDARVLQERVYGGAPGQGQGNGPLNPERRAISVRTRR